MRYPKTILFSLVYFLSSSLVGMQPSGEKIRLKPKITLKSKITRKVPSPAYVQSEILRNKRIFDGPLIREYAAAEKKRKMAYKSPDEPSEWNKRIEQAARARRDESRQWKGFFSHEGLSPVLEESPIIDLPSDDELPDYAAVNNLPSVGIEPLPRKPSSGSRRFRNQDQKQLAQEMEAALDDLFATNTHNPEK